LHTYRLFKNNLAFESYLDLDNFNRNILIGFRISAHNLEIEMGRHQNIPLNERICKLHNIYYTTILDVIIQCELGREPGGQTSLPDNNLVIVSVNDINSFMTILIIIIFSFLLQCPILN
jgi:hypothetical protein